MNPQTPTRQKCNILLFLFVRARIESCQVNGWTNQNAEVSPTQCWRVGRPVSALSFTCSDTYRFSLLPEFSGPVLFQQSGPVSAVWPVFLPAASEKKRPDRVPPVKKNGPNNVRQKCQEVGFFSVNVCIVYRSVSLTLFYLRQEGCFTRILFVCRCLLPGA